MTNVHGTWVWFLHFQTVHQMRVVPELTNEMVTFLTVQVADSDVEANPKKRKLEPVI